jgi:hypothetical protein
MKLETWSGFLTTRIMWMWVAWVRRWQMVTGYRNCAAARQRLIIARQSGLLSRRSPSSYTEGAEEDTTVGVVLQGLWHERRIGGGGGKLCEGGLRRGKKVARLRGKSSPATGEKAIIICIRWQTESETER